MTDILKLVSATVNLGVDLDTVEDLLNRRFEHVLDQVLVLIQTLFLFQDYTPFQSVVYPRFCSCFGCNRSFLPAVPRINDCNGQMPLVQFNLLEFL